MLTVKKIISFPLFILVGVVLLTSCIGKTPSIEDRIGDMSKLRDGAYEGIIEPLPELDVYQQGTHLLYDKDHKAIIIQSRTVDLNRYLNEEVRIEGKVSKGIGDAKDVLTVESIEYLDESRSQEMTAYENRSFGFRMEHPATWLLSEQSNGLTLDFEEATIVDIKVFDDEADLDDFLASEEEAEGVEVTIGAQRSIRFLSKGNMRFYVSNPPKEKVYLIKYMPTVSEEEDEKLAENELSLFYDMLESFELIYFTQLSGDKCGGLQRLECPENYRCELEGAGKYAEGICVPLDSGVSSSTCPFIATPSDCYDYRISEYSKNGCPARYECVEEESGGSQPTFRDLNIVDAGKKPEEYTESYEEGLDEEDTEKIAEDAEDPENFEENETMSDYKIPEVDEVTREYLNNYKNFSVLYPKNWYFASFGPSDKVDWAVGFANRALEEPEEAIITLYLMDKDGGRFSKKIGDTYYVIDGPVDLAEVMQAIVNSIEAF
jgi:hypothetical protein